MAEEEEEMLEGPYPRVGQLVLSLYKSLKGRIMTRTFYLDKPDRFFVVKYGCISVSGPVDVRFGSRLRFMPLSRQTKGVKMVLLASLLMLALKGQC